MPFIPMWAHSGRTINQGMPALRSRTLFICVILSVPGVLLPPQWSLADRPSSDPGNVPTSSLRWKDNRLDGELRDVSVEALLEELSSKGSFELEVKGDAAQTIDISFDRLTLHQSIKKLMRSAKCNYAIVWDPDVSHGIKKLIVYPAESSGKRRPRSMSPPQRPLIAERPTPARRVRGEPMEREAQIAQESTGTREDSTAEPKGEDAFVGSKQDLENFVDKLVVEKQLDPEQYRKIRESIEEKNL